MESLKELLKSREEFSKQLNDRHKYVTQEFQDYGYRLATKLGDIAHASMYIRLAKIRERVLLEQALSFTIDYPNAKSKGKIFLWKLKELQTELDKKRGVVKADKKSVKIKKKSKKPKGKASLKIKKEKVVNLPDNQQQSLF